MTSDKRYFIFNLGKIDGNISFAQYTICHPREGGDPETKMNKTYFVYILASQRNGTLYIGVTNNLEKRMWEHKNNKIEGFTKNYGVHTLVCYETTNDINMAIQREKYLKKYKREWKIKLIEKENPLWQDLLISN